MRHAVAIAALVGCFLTVAPQAAAQNDWQFPDPYFGALEFDIAKPPRASQRRVEAPAPSRPRPPRQRTSRHRPRWTATGART